MSSSRKCTGRRFQRRDQAAAKLLSPNVLCVRGTAHDTICRWTSGVDVLDFPKPSVCRQPNNTSYDRSLNKWTGSALLGTSFYNFHPLTSTLCPQTRHLLHHRRWCCLANTLKTYLRLWYLFTSFHFYCTRCMTAMFIYNLHLRLSY